MPTETPFHDPYKNCETGCTHLLGRGVLVNDELLKEDGEMAPTPQIVLPGQADIQGTLRTWPGAR